MRISNNITQTKLKIALCPMAGITDSAYRLMNVLGGADLVYSEMAHVNAISYRSKKTFEMLKASPFEFPYVVQLFGNDPKYFAEAAKIISNEGVPVMQYEPLKEREMEFINKLMEKREWKMEKNTVFLNFWERFIKFNNELNIFHSQFSILHFFKPAGLDINLGCPAKKVFGHGSGAALWKDLPKVRKIVLAVLENTKLPVSIKVRAAVGDVTIIDLLDTMKDLPIKRVMIHGRTYAQGFSGPIDTEIIKNIIHKYPQFEFWVNGGIINVESANKIMEKTGCANLGLARGTLGNPLLAEEIRIFSQKSKVESRKSNTKIIYPFASSETFQFTDYRLPIATQCILSYIHSLLNHQSKGKIGIFEMRKHLCWYFKDFPSAKDWRKKLVLVENIKDIEKILGGIAEAGGKNFPVKEK